MCRQDSVQAPLHYRPSREHVQRHAQALPIWHADGCQMLICASRHSICRYERCGLQPRAYAALSHQALICRGVTGTPRMAAIHCLRITDC